MELLMPLSLGGLGMAAIVYGVFYLPDGKK